MSSRNCSLYHAHRKYLQRSLKNECKVYQLGFDWRSRTKGRYVCLHIYIHLCVCVCCGGVGGGSCLLQDWLSKPRSMSKQPGWRDPGNPGESNPSPSCGSDSLHFKQDLFSLSKAHTGFLQTQQNYLQPPPAIPSHLSRRGQGRK